jgi:hypothetical protein
VAGAALIIAALAAILFWSQKASATAEVDTGTSMYSSDGSLTGAPITADRATWPQSDAIWKICCAIAHAEGYDDGDGYVPYDLNNPGDISDGAATFGSQPHSGSNVTTFPTAEVGWQWLHDKVQNIVSGASKVYGQDWTWEQVSQTWAGNSSAWLNNVTSDLGVDPSSTPAQYVSGQ